MYNSYITIKEFLELSHNFLCNSIAYNMELDLKYMEDNFLRDVERLNLRFPNAEIVRKTGAKKGNVSAYLKGKRPSENFLRTFYKAFDIRPEKQESKVLDTSGVNITLKDYIEEIQSTKKLLGDILRTEVSAIRLVLWAVILYGLRMEVCREFV
jgi:transcriptional regulator with XRE-family HTH domain